MKITVNGKAYTIDGEVYLDYQTQCLAGEYKGWQLAEPRDYAAASATSADGEKVTLYWDIEDKSIYDDAEGEVFEDWNHPCWIVPDED